MWNRVFRRWLGLVRPRIVGVRSSNKVEDLALRGRFGEVQAPVEVELVADVRDEDVQAAGLEGDDVRRHGDFSASVVIGTRQKLVCT